MNVLTSLFNIQLVRITSKSFLLVSTIVDKNFFNLVSDLNSKLFKSTKLKLNQLLLLNKLKIKFFIKILFLILDKVDNLTVNFVDNW